MNATQRDTLAIRTLLSPLIGEISAKRLFLGYGLFQAKDMFAIYDAERLFLRAKGTLATQLIDYGAFPWGRGFVRGSVALGHYFALPKTVMSDSTLLGQLLTLSLTQLREEKREEALKKCAQIRSLPNLTIRHERMLAKVGILTVQDMRLLGAVNCYIRLKKQGLVSRLGLFWLLSAALLHKRVERLSIQEQDELLRSLNRALQNAGLAPMAMDRAAY